MHDIQCLNNNNFIQNTISSQLSIIENLLAIFNQIRTFAKLKTQVEILNIFWNL